MTYFVDGPKHIREYFIATCNAIYVTCVNCFIAANASPNISVDAVLNATLGAESSLTVSKFDPDGDEVTVTLDSPPDGATFDGVTFKWTPVTLKPVKISYVFLLFLYICYIIVTK